MRVSSSRLVFASLFITSWVSAVALGDNWPQWRGPNLNGTSGEKNLPVKWGVDENVAWKLALPGFSGSTPVIWGERIFLNVADGDDLWLWCVDRKQGTALWKKSLGAGNKKVRKQNMSSPSPVTDGKNVYTMTGTGILKGFDFDGKEIWSRDIQKDYGKFGQNWGYASSPLLYEDSLYVEVLHGAKTTEPSYILRINKATGKNVWKVKRETDAVGESPDAYTTPTLVRYTDHVEIVILGGDALTGHDPLTGKEIWRGRGLNPENEPDNRIIASPVVADGVIYAPTHVRPFLAYRAGGRGDITKSNLMWTAQYGPDVPSPVTDGTYLYLVHDKGIVWCLDAKTGKEFYGPVRLAPGTYTASPVLADGKIYVTNEDGLTSVLKAGAQFEVLAENALNDYCLSSPAVSDGQIFIRTSGALYCIGKRAAK
jgi:outer membrane protein assembly factor BamB